MRGLNTATVIDLLNRLRADRHLELGVTAAGRSAGIHATATAIASVGAAIAAITDGICPLQTSTDGSRADQCWRDVRDACDQAAQHTARLADQVTRLAAEALLVVTEMEPVHYRGSITSRHGTHVLAGPCDCWRCRHRGDRLRLSLLLEDFDDLVCVRPRSVTAYPDEPHDLPAADLGDVLHVAVGALPPSLTVGHAIAVVQNLILFTGRIRAVVGFWATTIDARLHGGSSPSSTAPTRPITATS
ncbi:hypothetical protein [Actinoplanes sp. HUAS TT8]|uniref:hypothetical protein n=1 Tax=Actinoplanes sp. HUAS TT8 TaxID=3447453 RepID=UPI003F52637B